MRLIPNATDHVATLVNVIDTLLSEAPVPYRFAVDVRGRFVVVLEGIEAVPLIADGHNPQALARAGNALLASASWARHSTLRSHTP